MRGHLRLVALAVSLTGCTAGARRFFDPPPQPRTRAGVLGLQWRRPLADYSELDYRPSFHGAPALDLPHDRLFLGSPDHGLYALRARDGALLWRFETLGVVDSSPTIDRDMVFFGAQDGALYAVDAARGGMRWRVATPAEVVHPPVVIDDSVYFDNANDTVFSVSRADGTSRWRYHRDPPGGITLSGYAGLARVGNRLYTGFSDGTIVCLDARDGSIVWQRDTANDLENIEERNEAHEAIDVDTTPVVINDTVYVASYAAGLYALDAVGGGQRWRLSNVVEVSALGTDGQFLYAASATSGLLKIDPNDGTIAWARDLGSHAIVGTTPIGAGMLAVPTADGAMWVVRSADGEPIDGLQQGRGFGALPSVLDDRLYVASNGAVLYAFRLTEPAFVAR